MGVIAYSVLHVHQRRGRTTGPTGSSPTPTIQTDPSPSGHRRSLAALSALCRRYRIERLSLFGSTLKGTNRSDTNVNLLVKFEPAARRSVFTMAENELALSPVVCNRCERRTYATRW